MNRIVQPFIVAFVVFCMVRGPMVEGQTKKPQTTKEKAKKKQKIDRYTGTVTKLKQVNVLRGKDTKYTIVLLTPKDSEKDVIVDLGPTQQLTVGIKKGDSITVEGPSLRVGKYPKVLMAFRVKKDGKSQEISRRNTRRGFAEGVIRRRKVIKLRNSDEKNLVLWIETKDGQIRMVDLGNVKNLKGTPTTAGNKIRARGWVIRVRRRPVLLATEVTIGDDTRNIERPKNTEKSKTTK